MMSDSFDVSTMLVVPWQCKPNTNVLIVVDSSYNIHKSTYDTMQVFVSIIIIKYVQTVKFVYYFNLHLITCTINLKCRYLVVYLS